MYFKTLSLFIVIGAVLIIPQNAFSQNKVITLPTNANHQVEFVENITVPNTNKSQLFKKALNWVIGTKFYKFKKLDLMDSGFSRLIASGVFVFGVDEVFISLNMDLKDNKVQLKITRFDYNMMVGNIPLDNLANYKTKEAKILIPQTAEAIKLLIKDFRFKMGAVPVK